DRLDWCLDGLRCVGQGFGNVGGIAANELHERGASVIAVSDVSGGLHSDDGLDVPALQAYVVENGSLEGFAAGRRVSNEELLELAWGRPAPPGPPHPDQAPHRAPPARPP